MTNKNIILSRGWFSTYRENSPYLRIKRTPVEDIESGGECRPHSNKKKSGKSTQL